MRIVKLILIILVMAVIITFVILNNEQQAAIKFIKWSSPNLPIWIICLLSALVGFILTFFFVHAPGSIKLNARIKSLNKEIKTLTTELNRLRNAGLDEESVDDLVPGSQGQDKTDHLDKESGVSL